MEKESLITAALAALTFAAFAGWFLMARRPRQWAEWVEKENNFWQAKGLISSALAERLKRWETGKMLKSLAAITTCVGLIGFGLSLTVWLRMVSLRHHKLRVPYNPALHLIPQPPKQQLKPK